MEQILTINDHEVVFLDTLTGPWDGEPAAVVFDLVQREILVASLSAIMINPPARPAPSGGLLVKNCYMTITWTDIFGMLALFAPTALVIIAGLAWGGYL